MKRNLLILCCSLAFGQAMAQNVEFDKDNFKQNKDAFKDAKKKLDEGDDIFAANSKKTDEAYRRANYRKAIAPYTVAYEFNPNSATLNYRLGVAYLFSEEKSKAVTFLEKAKKLNPSIHPDLGFYLGRAYQVNMDWQPAITEYKRYMSTLPTDKNKDRIQLVNQHIRECLSGEDLQKRPARVFIDNIGPEINTEYPEYSPILSADESVLVFTSVRPAAPVVPEKKAKEKEEKAKEEEPLPTSDDLFFSTKVNGKWSPVKNLGEPINSDKFESAVALSADGQKLIFYREESGGDLFESTLKGDVWTKPENLKNINSNANEVSATYSFDGKTLYFVSDRPNGIGKHDIYFSVKDSKGEWGKPVNAGPELNTPYEEGNVFLMPDGKTLYFSSEGHTSMGGFDIFKSVYENGKWSKPENMGFPINSPDDDVAFVMGASGRYGYFSSNRIDKTKATSDIYKVTFLGPEKPMVLNAEDDLMASISLQAPQAVTPGKFEVKTPKSVLVQGMVVDAKTNAPLEARVDIIDNVRKEIITSFTTNSLTGKYLVSLPAGKNYGIAISRDKYLFHSENFTIPAGAPFQKVEKDVKMKLSETGNGLVLRNIFFDKGQAPFKPESVSELDRVVELLKDNRSAKAEISVFTDNQGDAAQNVKLSEDRAKAVLDYLVSKGINAKRLQSKGYGAEQPIASNDSEEGRQLNQRVELKLLGK